MWESMSLPFFQVLYNLVRDFFYALVYRMFVPIAIGIGSPPFFSEACLEKDRLSFLYEQHRLFETLQGKMKGFFILVETYLIMIDQINLFQEQVLQGFHFDGINVLIIDL